jgi:branched-chain amino acid transport system permease protein
MDAFAVGSDRSVADLVRVFGAAVGPDTFGWALLKVKVSQTAAILPYLLLVLVLIFRPKGILGTREG